RVGDTSAGVGIGEALALELDVEALEVGERLRDAADGHPAPDLAPEAERRLLLDLDQRPPTEARVPAERLEDEGGEDVEEVFVRDREPAVDLVHAADRAPPQVGVVARL